MLGMRAPGGGGEVGVRAESGGVCEGGEVRQATGLARILGMCFKVFPVALMAAAALSEATATAAPAPRQRFEVPAGPLAQAINRLALESGRQVLFSPDAARGKWTQGFAGALSLDDALSRLLAGSGLDYAMTSGGMVIITAADAVRPDRAAAPRTLAAEPNLVEALVVVPGLAEAPTGVERLNVESLDRSVAPGLRDATRLSSSITAVPNGGGDLKLALRGVYGAGEATTPLYFAGSPISAPSGTTSDPGLVTPDLLLVDIDHLDVLRGPQGVDHGAGAIGGELRIVPREPLLGVAQGEVSAQVNDIEGGRPGYQLAAVGNLPFGDSVAVRGVLYRRTSGGYVDNVRLGLDDVNGERTEGGRLAVQARPTDELEVNAFAVYQRRTLGDTSAWNRSLGAYESDRYAMNWNRQRIGVLGANLRRQTEGLTLSSTTAFYDWTIDRQLDSTELMQGLAQDPAGCIRYFALGAEDCTAAQMQAFTAYVTSRTPSALVQRTSIHSFVEELRAEGELPSGRWVTGLFYESRAEHARSAAMVIDPTTDAVLTSAGYTGLRLLGSNYQQVAAYADVMRQVTSHVSLTAGVRYAATQRSAWSDVLIPDIVTGSTESVPKDTRNGGRATGLLRAEWQSAGGLAYIQASTGSRPGGVNTTPDPAQTRKVFGPDSLTNYEIGGRRRWFDGALTAQVAAFRIAVRDMQFLAATPNGAFGYVVNIGSARINGAEAAIHARRGPFTADFNAAVTDARLTGSDAGRDQVRGARSGDPIPNIPRYRYVLGLSYRHPLPRGSVLVASWQDEHRSSVASQFRPDDPYYLRVPGYMLESLSVSLERGPATLTAAVHNVFNVEAVDRAFTTAYGAGQTLSAAPRTFSLMVRRRW
jgi:outer membrane receptor protein involved in Fe transport